MSAARYPCCYHCTGGRCDTPDDHPIPCLWKAACIEITQTPIYADPDFTPGMVVADLDGGPDDRRTWEAFQHEDSDEWAFDRLWSPEVLGPWSDRSGLPARLGVVDPETGRLNR